MEIVLSRNENELTVGLTGRLDTTTAADLEKVLGTELDTCEALVFDFEHLKYVSSAGLRILLSAQKKMKARKCTMVIRKANELIIEIFETTGFLDIFTIEE
ncbi:MAG: STAS domain-containing protein [Porcipelethomonas sp.]